LLRQYGAKNLKQTPGAGEAAHDRHCAYYVAALQAWERQLRGSRQQIALKELDEEIENARAAWNWAIAQGQVTRLDQALDSLCLYYQWRGRYREGEIAYGQAVEKLAPVATGEVQRVLARLLIWQGTLMAFSQGRSYLNQGLSLLGQPAPATKVRLMFGLVHLRRKKSDLALAAAEESISLMAGIRPAPFLSLPGYASVAETYLRLWEAKTIAQTSAPTNPKVMGTPNSGKIKRLKSGAKQACKALRRYAQIFPIGQSRAYLWHGTYQWLSGGRPNAARKLWATSLAVAGTLEMP